MGLPPGLAIDPATGVISGTLDFGVAAGSPYRVTVAASDDGSPVLAAGGSFTWSIGDVDRAPVLGSLPDRAGEVGDAVSATLTATDPDGDPLTWSASGLPPGVSLDASGHLGGTLGGAGAFTVTVTVRAGGASDSGSFTWVGDRARGPGDRAGGQPVREGRGGCVSRRRRHQPRGRAAGLLRVRAAAGPGHRPGHRGDLGHARRAPACSMR